MAVICYCTLERWD